MNKDKDLARTFADVVLDHSLEFTIGKRTFRLYPVTLAKMLMLRPHTEALCIDNAILRDNPYLESLRFVSCHREECCHILALHTAPNTRAALHDTGAVSGRRELFMAKMGNSDLSALMLHVMSADRTDELMHYFGLDRERERLGKVMEVKRKTSRNNLSFGGVTLLGTFIGQLKEMGYTDEEILYERGYSYLRLMLADKITYVSVTDEELSQIPEEVGGTFLQADDPDAADSLMSFFEERGVHIEK